MHSTVGVAVDNKNRAWGSARDPEQAVRVAAAWRDGTTIRELITAYPFMRTDRFALAREDGNLLEVLWDFHLEDPGTRTCGRSCGPPMTTRG